MTHNQNNMVFKEYLMARGVVVMEGHNHYNENKEIQSHVKVIAEFHKKAAGYREYGNNSLKDNLGRDIEKAKVEIKKFKKLLQEIKLKGSENQIEEAILKYGDDIVERANKGLKVSYNNKYLDIIKRSMDRGEVCMGNPYYDNICENQGLLLVNINNCIYDLVESDCIAFLKRLRKKGIKFELDKLIDQYCSLEGLDLFSKEYISSLALYPGSVIRFSIRYWEKEFVYNEVEGLIKFNKALSYEK